MLRAVFSARFLRSISKIQRPEEAGRFLRLDKYWCPEVAEALLTRIDELTPLKPKQALGLARIAVELTQRIRKAPRDLQAHAHCSLASSLRETGDLEASALEFARAQDLAVGCRIATRSLVLRQQAVLLVQRGQPEEALRQAQLAVTLESSNGIVPTKSMVIEGAVRFLRSEYRESAECWKSVLLREDPKTDLYIITIQNLAAVLTRLDLTIKEAVEARKFLQRVQLRIKGIRETPVRYVIWHTEGLLHGFWEEYKLAIDHFQQARAGFLKLDMIAEFGRVSIDLIDVLVKRGDLEKARVTLERTAKRIEESNENPVFHSAFRGALAQPIERATDFLRMHITLAPNAVAQG